jgi:hypothetical protein
MYVQNVQVYMIHGVYCTVESYAVYSMYIQYCTVNKNVRMCMYSMCINIYLCNISFFDVRTVNYTVRRYCTVVIIQYPSGHSFYIGRVIQRLPGYKSFTVCVHVQYVHYCVYILYRVPYRVSSQKTLNLHKFSLQCIYTVVPL